MITSKIEVSVEQEIKQPIVYPTLRVSVDQTLVVLFCANREGFVVYGGKNSPYKIGEYYRNWYDIYCGDWTILPKGTKIILEQT